MSDGVKRVVVGVVRELRCPRCGAAQTAERCRLDSRGPVHGLICGNCEVKSAVGEWMAGSLTTKNTKNTKKKGVIQHDA